MMRFYQPTFAIAGPALLGCLVLGLPLETDGVKVDDYAIDAEFFPEQGRMNATADISFVPGTVTDDTAAAVNQLKAGRVEFRMDRNGNIAVPFGKRSFTPEALAENAKAVLDAIQGARPASAKGTYIKRCTISSTMGPGLRVALKELSV